MSKSKQQWQEEDLVWSKAMSAYVPRKKQQELDKGLPGDALAAQTAELQARSAYCPLWINVGSLVDYAKDTKQGPVETVRITAKYQNPPGPEGEWWIAIQGMKQKGETHISVGRSLAERTLSESGMSMNVWLEQSIERLGADVEEQKRLQEARNERRQERQRFEADRAIGDREAYAYLDRGTPAVAPMPRDAGVYNNPMEGDFSTPEDPAVDDLPDAVFENRMTDRDEPPRDADDWEAYGRESRSTDEFSSGDSMDDFEAINRAASRGDRPSEKLSAPQGNKTAWNPLTRRYEAPWDRPSLSDSAAGRFTGTIGSKYQGDLFGKYNDDYKGDRWGGYSTKAPAWFNQPVKPKEIRTSVSHPIKVNFVEQKVHGRSGELGMTFCPGKKHSGMSAEHNRDVDLDMKTLNELGVNTIVCLIEDHEFDSLKVPDLLERAHTAGIDTLWHPVRDYGVPNDTEAYMDLINAVLDDLEAGKKVVVHCKGGLGRTGTLVASVLVALGWTPKEAMAHTRAARKGTVENQTQENYVDWIDTCFE